MYTKTTLEPINQSYLSEHSLNERDVTKVNTLIGEIEGRRQGESVPQDGDLVICEKPDGTVVSKRGHMQASHWEPGYLTICVHPYTPFVAPGCTDSNASGGYWFNPSLTDLQYVGRDLKMFCTWGHIGMCRSGAIDFQAEVNVWKIRSEKVY